MGTPFKWRPINVIYIRESFYNIITIFGVVWKRQKEKVVVDIIRWWGKVNTQEKPMPES